MAERRHPLNPRKDFHFGYSETTNKAAFVAAEKLMREEGLSWGQAVASVTHEIDGAGEGLTVESMATCRDLAGNFVEGLTTDDSLEPRTDRYAKSEKIRHLLAELGLDEAGEFILSKDRDTFVKLHGRKLVESSLLLGLRNEFPSSPDAENLRDFSWKQLCDQVLAAINDRARQGEKKRRSA